MMRRVERISPGPAASEPALSIRQQSVLALVTDAFGGYGGIAQYNRDFLSALSGVPSIGRIEVLPRIAPGDLEQMLGLISQHPPISGRVRYSIGATKLALESRPSIIFNGHLFHSPLAAALARFTKAKLINQLHGTEIWGELNAHHRRALEASDLILAVSRDTRARILAKVNIQPERVVVVNNTYGPEFNVIGREFARAKHGLAEQKVVLTVSRLDDRDGYKGHDRVMPLIQAYRERWGAISYLIAGVGPDQARLEALATELGIQENVKFLGKVARESLPDLYRAADLFAMPSTGEGFGISFIEAMACGTPAIGLAVGGAPDALGSGELGICVDEANFPSAFIDALRSPHNDPVRLSAAIRERFGPHTFRARAGEAMSLLR